MNLIKRVTKLLSSKKLIKKNKAHFVNLGNDRFKYNPIYNISNNARAKVNRVKDIAIKLWQGFKLTSSKVDWKVMRNDFGEWSFVVSIEGLTANFATHYLLGLPMSPGTIIAHGIAINQSISIYWRLKQNGEHSKIPKKD